MGWSPEKSAQLSARQRAGREARHDDLCDLLGEHDDLCPRKDRLAVKKAERAEIDEYRARRTAVAARKVARSHLVEKTDHGRKIVDKLLILAGIEADPSGAFHGGSVQVRALKILADTLGLTYRRMQVSGKVTHVAGPSAPAPVTWDPAKLTDEQLAKVEEAVRLLAPAKVDGDVVDVESEPVAEAPEDE